MTVKQFKISITPIDIASMLVGIPQGWLVRRVAPGLSRKQRMILVLGIAGLERLAVKAGLSYMLEKTKREHAKVASTEMADKLAEQIMNLVGEPRRNRPVTGDIPGAEKRADVSDANDLSFADLLARNAERRVEQQQRVRERIARSGGDYTSPDA